jgi:hypothetical protein
LPEEVRCPKINETSSQLREGAGYSEDNEEAMKMLQKRIVLIRINGSSIRCDEEWMFVRADTAHAEYP